MIQSVNRPAAGLLAGPFRSAFSVQLSAGSVVRRPRASPNDKLLGDCVCFWTRSQRCKWRCRLYACHFSGCRTGRSCGHASGREAADNLGKNSESSSGRILAASGAEGARLCVTWAKRAHVFRMFSSCDDHDANLIFNLFDRFLIFLHLLRLLAQKLVCNSQATRDKFNNCKRPENEGGSFA